MLFYIRIPMYTQWMGVSLQVLEIILLILLLTMVQAEAFSKSGDFAVLRGGMVSISCIPGAAETSAGHDIGATYSWTDELGKELIDARLTKTASGELEIVNAHFGDSGLYKCKYRPPNSASNVERESKIFEHKLIVYEISGHKFESQVYFDMSQYSTEVTLNLLHDLITATVCKNELCTTGPIKLMKCELLETIKQMCEFLMTYEAINQVTDESCDEDCVRETMFKRLKKAEKILESELLAMSENTKSRLKPDMKTFDTRHLITCRAGFHLVKSHYKRCFPCKPGTYSQANSFRCELCNIGSYQEHYGRHDCDKCEESKTTDTMGAKSRDECTPAERGGGFFNDIKEGIQSIFRG